MIQARVLFRGKALTTNKKAASYETAF